MALMVTHKICPNCNEIKPTREFVKRAFCQACSPKPKPKGINMIEKIADLLVDAIIEFTTAGYGQWLIDKGVFGRYQVTVHKIDDVAWLMSKETAVEV